MDVVKKGKVLLVNKRVCKQVNQDVRPQNDTLGTPKVETAPQLLGQDVTPPAYIHSNEITSPKPLSDPVDNSGNRETRDHTNLTCDEAVDIAKKVIQG